jgi:hypothetical protein
MTDTTQWFHIDTNAHPRAFLRGAKYHLRSYDEGVSVARCNRKVKLDESTPVSNSTWTGQCNLCRKIAKVTQ